MSRFANRLLIVTVVLVVWLAGGLWLVPELIRDAYYERSASFINAIISGRGTIDVEAYLRQWWLLFIGATIALVLLAIAFHYRGRIRGRLARLRAGVGAETVTGRELLGLALAFGLFAGWMEAAGVLAKTLLRDLPHWGPGYSAEVVWMAPAGSAILFVFAAVLLVATAYLFRQTLPARAVVFGLGFLACYVSLRSLRTGFHPVALLLLAMGIAAQLARWSAARPSGVRTVARRWTAVAAVAALASAVVVAIDARSRTDMYARRSGAMNVVFIILDTVRAANLGIYGHTRATTPNIRRLARQSIIFDRAVSTAPWTLPSHASMFTGRLPSEVDADWETPLDAQYPTLAEILAEHGYRTGGFVGNEFFTAKRSGLARGFQTYRDHPVNFEMLISNSWPLRKTVALFQGKKDIIPPWGVWGRKQAVEVNDEFVEWLDDNTDHRPFFAFLNYMDAHYPYESHEPFDTMFGGRRIPVRIDWNDRYSRKELNLHEVAYDQTIRYLDTQVGALVESLQRRRLLDRTMIVITADHGEQFGERMQAGVLHGRNLYFSVLHVPLIIVLPAKLRAHSRVATPVSIRDLPATVLDVLGIDERSVGGRSLAPHWQRSPAATALTAVAVPAPSEIRRRNPSEANAEVWRNPMRSLVSGNLHYIRNGNGSEELYDIRLDPWERNPLTAATNDSAFTEFRANLTKTFGPGQAAN